MASTVAPLGEDAKGLSANVVSRLKAQWADEHASWNQRDLSAARYVYWWVDGIHTGLRSEGSDGQCLLVIIGVTPDGRKERVAIGDGYRESKASWAEVLLDLNPAVCRLARWRRSAMAPWDSGLPWRRCSRPRVPSVAGFTKWECPDALPKSQHGRAKADLQAIWMAATRQMPMPPSIAL